MADHHLGEKGERTALKENAQIRQNKKVQLHLRLFGTLDKLPLQIGANELFVESVFRVATFIFNQDKFLRKSMRWLYNYLSKAIKAPSNRAYRSNRLNN